MQKNSIKSTFIAIFVHIWHTKKLLISPAKHVTLVSKMRSDDITF